MTTVRRLALWVAMFFLPLQQLALFDLGALPITPTKVSWVLVFGAAAAQWATGPRAIPWSAKHLWVLGFGFSFVVSNLVAVLSGLPFLGVLPYFTTDVSLLALYLAVLVLTRTQRDLDFLIGGLVLGSVVLAVSGFFGLEMVQDAESGDRLTGLAGNPNGTAANIAVALPLIVTRMTRERSAFRRIAAAAITVLLLVAGISTLSRSLFVVLPAMWLLSLSRSGSRQAFRYAAVGCAIMFLVVLLAPEALRERFSMLAGKARLADSSARSRLVQNELALTAFVENPVAGVGRRNFINWAAKDERVPGMNVIHNTYLNVAAEQGLLGLVPFFGILILAWREYSRCWKLLGRRGEAATARELRARALGLQIALLGILVGALFHPLQNFKPLWVVLALSTSMVAMCRGVVTAHGAESRAGEGREDPGWRDVPATAVFSER